MLSKDQVRLCHTIKNKNVKFNVSCAIDHNMQTLHVIFNGKLVPYHELEENVTEYS